MTDTQTLTLTKFLLARIAEDEDRGQSLVAQWWDVGNACQSCGTDGARVLAECEAKRRIIEIHEVLKGDPYGEITDRTVYWCPACDHDRDYVGIPHEEEGCPTIRTLALPYVSHPDYREDWKV